MEVRKEPRHMLTFGDQGGSREPRKRRPER